MDETPVVPGGAGDENQPVVASQDAAGDSNASGKLPCHLSRPTPVLNPSLLSIAITSIVAREKDRE